MALNPQVVGGLYPESFFHYSTVLPAQNYFLHTVSTTAFHAISAGDTITEMNFFRNKNVLVTGGAGFIGSNLAIRLANEGAKVLAIDSFLPELGSIA